MYNRRYDKEYIIFDCEAKSFGLWGKAPGGTAALEIKDGKGRLNLLVQGLKLPGRDDYYRVYLISRGDGGTLGAGAVALPLDDMGSCRARWDFNPDNVAGTGLPIESFQAVAVMLKGKSYSDINIIAPLTGYIGESFDWRDKFYEFKGNAAPEHSKSPGGFVMAKGPAKPVISKQVSSSANASFAPKAVSSGPGAMGQAAAAPPVEESAVAEVSAARPAAKSLRELINFGVPGAKPLANAKPAEANGDSAVYSMAEPFSAGEKARPAAKSIGELLNFKAPGKPFAGDGTADGGEEAAENTGKQASPAAKSIGEIIKIRRPGEIMAAAMKEAPAENARPIKEAPGGKEAADAKESAAVKESPGRTPAKSIGEFVKVMKKEELLTPEPEEETAGTKKNSDFVTMVKKFREELIKLQEMSVLSAEDVEIAAAPETKTDRLFMENTRMYPFGQDDETEWVRMSRREMALCPVNNLNLMDNPGVILAYRRYRHFVLGRYMMGNERKYLFGIPDFYSRGTAQEFKDAGFGYFRSCGGEMPAEGVNGYWIMEF